MLKLLSVQLELEVPLSEWRSNPADCCRRALLSRGEPLRWAITAAEVQAEVQWLQLEAVLIV